MSYAEQAYEPSDLDGEIFLSDAPLSLLMRAIQTQFDSPAEYRRKDYIDSFITKYQFCRDHQEDEGEEFKEEIDEYYAQFVSFMQDLFENYLRRKFGHKKSPRNAREPKGIDMKLTNWSKSILFIFIIYLEEYE